MYKKHNKYSFFIINTKDHEQYRNFNFYENKKGYIHFHAPGGITKALHIDIMSNRYPQETKK